MATWASSDLLARFNELSGRPASGDSLSDTNKYKRLSDAQQVVLSQVATICPKAFVSKVAYASTPTLTTTDQQVFTYGNDLNSNPLFPIGKVRIYESLASIPDYPWQEGIDYIDEGTQIRIPNNATYGGTLYWRGVAQPLDITSTNQPTIIPVNYRILIVYEAVRRYALEGKRDVELSALMSREYDREFARFCMVLKTQMSSGGAIGSVSGLRLSLMGNAGLVGSS